MLFPLDPNTPKCKIFEKLNEEFLFFLQACITSEEFTRALFSESIGQECWDNEPTNKKFKDTWEQLPNSQIDKQNLFDLINSNQDVSLLFSDKTAVIPTIQPEKLFKALKALTTHLFTRTKKLVGIVQLATESIREHYQAYVHSNSELCFLCGTAALSHNRFDVADDEQWTSDYDHLLCKDKYPVYSCHPDNFIPTCHICNSKAKGADDILIEKVSGRRRKALYPLPPITDSLYQKMRVHPIFAELTNFAVDGNSNPLQSISIKYANPTLDEQDMISAWVTLYQVPSRVNSRISSTFCEYIDADCTPLDFDDFCEQIARKASREPRDMKTTEWRFWWFRLYEWLNSQDEAVKRDAWELIDWKQSQVNVNEDAEQTFNI